ncbi:MAG: phage terminase small subunit P27 family [Vallitalea sp.]|jgi:P27 family predicted phage terminase small subunit|nr:phage terminase small subunit P27 family [Vallitalea sp.]
MAKASKPVEMTSKHLTKQEIAERKKEEEKLKGNDDKVYKPPSHLSKEEKKLYKFLVKELRESSILCNLDITILETTVDAIVNMQKCKQKINELGIVVKKGNGDIVKNPACTAYKDYNSIFNKCLQELGLSPSARARLSQLNVQTEKNKNDEILKIRKRREERGD